MNKIKVYLASPYTIGDTAENVREQLKAANKLMDCGFVPFIPLLSHFMEIYHPRSFDDWMEYDLEWLKSCDVILRLPGESKGADKEANIAHNKFGMPVYYSVNDLINGS